MRPRGRATAGFLALVLWAIPVVAGHGPDATILTVKAAYVRRLLEARERVVLIDLRPAGDYEKGRLPGARSVPAGELRRRQEEIPKAGLVVFSSP